MFQKYKDALDKIKLSIHTSLYINAGEVFVFQVHRITYNPLTLKVKIFTSRPGLVIGRQGKLFNEIKSNLHKDLRKRVKLEIVDYKPFSG